MEILLYLGIFIVSLTVLLKASDYFISAAEKIGIALGIPPFIIGVTIVAFGTSLPELATSIASVYANKSSIVVGNVIGSNITNISLVLGIAAFYVKDIKLSDTIWKQDMPFLIGSSFLLWVAIRDQHFSLIEAMIFLVGMVIFLTYSFGASGDEKTQRSKVSFREIGLLIGGGIAVYFGADYTIYAISNISAIMGISPEVIALTAVALGTSLPEVFVSLSAAKKGKMAIAVGNVLGSNIFNTFAVMAIPSFFGVLEIPPGILTFSLPLMIILTILFGFTTISTSMSRWEGALFLMFYFIFVVELFKNVG